MAVQIELPALEVRPTGHVVQNVEPGPEKVFEGQFVHTRSPGVKEVPPGHVKHILPDR